MVTVQTNTLEGQIEREIQELLSVLNYKDIWAQREAFYFPRHFSYENQEFKEIMSRLWYRRNFKKTHLSVEDLELEKKKERREQKWKTQLEYLKFQPQSYGTKIGRYTGRMQSGIKIAKHSLKKINTIYLKNFSDTINLRLEQLEDRRRKWENESKKPEYVPKIYRNRQEKYYNGMVHQIGLIGYHLRKIDAIYLTFNSERKRASKLFHKACAKQIEEIEEIPRGIAKIVAGAIRLPKSRRKEWKKPEFKSSIYESSLDEFINGMIYDSRVMWQNMEKASSFVKDAVVGGGVIGNLPKRYVDIDEKLTNKKHLFDTKANLTIVPIWFLGVESTPLYQYLHDKIEPILTGDFVKDASIGTIIFTSIAVGHIITRVGYYFKRLYDCVVKKEHTGDPAYLINPALWSAAFALLPFAYDLGIKGVHKYKYMKNTYIDWKHPKLDRANSKDNTLDKYT